MKINHNKLLILLLILPFQMLTATAQVEDAGSYAVISDALSELNTVRGWSMQDNGRWASQQNTIPFSDFKTTRNPTPKHRLGMDNFLELEMRKVLINDRQYTVLIKMYRDGEYEFPVMEEGWRSYNSVEYYVFPSENLVKILPDNLEFDRPYSTNLDVFTYGKITDYDPYQVTDKIVNRINSTLNSTYINTADLVVALWPVREENNEYMRFKLIKTFNKPTISSYYLDPRNLDGLFANSYYETFFYRFKSFVDDAKLFYIPDGSTSEFMSLYKKGIMKYQAGNFEHAIEDFNEALKLNPNPGDFMIFAYRGNAKTKLRNFNGAIEDFDRALEIKPTEVIDYSNWIRNYHNRGVARFYLEDLSGACEDWHKAYELGYGLSLEYLNKYCQ